MLQCLFLEMFSRCSLYRCAVSFLEILLKSRFPYQTSRFKSVLTVKQEKYSPLVRKRETILSVPVIVRLPTEIFWRKPVDPLPIPAPSVWGITHCNLEIGDQRQESRENNGTHTKCIYRVTAVVI